MYPIRFSRPPPSQSVVGYTGTSAIAVSHMCCRDGHGPSEGIASVIYLNPADTVSTDLRYTLC